MKRTLLLLTALTLSACTPALRPPTSATVGAVTTVTQMAQQVSLTREGLTLLLTNGGAEPLTGDPSRPGDGPGLVVTGVNIQPDEQAEAWCKPAPVNVGVRWSCTLPEVGKDPLKVGFVAADPAAAASITQASGIAYRVSSGALPVPYRLN